MKELFEKEYSGYDQSVLDLEGVRFNLYLISFRNCIGPDRTIEKTWTNLRFHQIHNRWWYFRRIAALMQIEKPHRVFSFHVERTLNDIDLRAAQIKRIRDKAISAKAKITQVENKIEVAKNNWNALFPIEDDPSYQKAMAYLFQKRSELKDFEDQINQLTDDSINP